MAKSVGRQPRLNLRDAPLFCFHGPIRCRLVVFPCTQVAIAAGSDQT